MRSGLRNEERLEFAEGIGQLCLDGSFIWVQVKGRAVGGEELFLLSFGNTNRLHELSNAEASDNSVAGERAETKGVIFGRSIIPCEESEGRLP